MKRGFPRKVLKWLLGLSCAGLIGLVLLFLGSNLFLKSSAGRKFLVERLERRTGDLIWTVKSASWSPWDGIRVEGLEARLRDERFDHPLFSVKEAVIQLYWKDVILGRRLLREIVFHQPELNLPLEGLIVGATAPPQANAEPAPEKAEPSQRPEAPEKSPEAPSDKTPPPEPAPKPSPAPTPPSEVVPKERDERRIWLKIVDARVHLYSLAGPSTTIEGLHLKAPLAGPPTKGQLTWETIKVGDTEVIEPSQTAIQWKHPAWTIPSGSLRLLNLEGQIQGVFAFRDRNPRFSFNLALPSQPFPKTTLHPETGISLAADEMASYLSASGLLFFPGTWRLDQDIAVRDIQVSSVSALPPRSFESSTTQIRLRKGVIFAPRFELRSEELSVLGNGHVTLNTQCLFVSRVVASPEIGESLTRVMIGSRLTPWTRRWMAPLQTPDRVYRDLQLEGPISNLVIDTYGNANEGRFVPLAQVATSLRRFLSNETLEEIPLDEQSE